MHSIINRKKVKDKRLKDKHPEVEKNSIRKLKIKLLFIYSENNYLLILRTILSKIASSTLHFVMY